jgi:hypothetical protein
VEAGIGLGRVLCPAHIVQKELMKARRNLHEFVALRVLRRGGRETQPVRRNLRTIATKTCKANSEQRAHKRGIGF